MKVAGVCMIQVPIQPGLPETVEYDGPKPEEFGHVEHMARTSHRV